MKPTHRPFLKALLVLSALAASAFAAAAQTSSVAPRITHAIDEGKLVTLRANTPAQATAANDRGAISYDTHMEHMLLQLQRSPQQEQALREYIDELTKPGSPNYHNWLTAEQYGQRFGVAQADLDAITNWLAGHGLTANFVYPSRMVIDFSGTAGQVHDAFRTEIHALDVNGVKHISNLSDPLIPAALVPAVAGVVSLHDFMPHRMFKPKPKYTFPVSGGSAFGVVPADLATIYNLNPVFTSGVSGQGQTVVVIEDTNLFSTTDWNTFRSTFGLSSFTSGKLTQVQPPPPSGATNCALPVTNSSDNEAAIDVEYSSAAAPSATIELASCSDSATTFGGFLALQNLVNSSSPPAIISLSLGFCEAGNGAGSNAAINSIYQQAASEGVSLYVSAGDEGAASCDAGDTPVGPDAITSAKFGIGVSAWASTIYNVAVGGTDFSDTFASTNSTYWNSSNTSTFGSAKSYIPEIPWNDSCASALITSFLDPSATPYGSSGFCNSTTAATDELLTTAAGSGGPSGCATGTPTTSNVVSGTCAGYAKPSWQSITGNPADGVRDIPDVSMFAANGVWDQAYIFCFSDTANGGAACTGAPSGWSAGGGTSFGAPIWAGIQALINQKTGARQGNPNPTFYSLASTEYGSSASSCNSSLGNTVGTSCIFYDVTQGDMDVNCTGTHSCFLPSGTYGVLSTSDSSDSIGYGTASGWDFATGIGTVNVANLVNNWPGAVATPSFNISAAAASPSTVAPGSMATSTVTVSGTNGFAGSVTLSCTVVGSLSTDTNIPTCALTPTAVTLSSTTTSATSTATVSTMAASTLMHFPGRAPSSGGLAALALAIALACMFALGAPGRKRQWSAIAVAVLFVALAGLAGCGSSGSSSGSNNGNTTTGTSADTYTVTVTASSSGTSQTSTFTVTVN
ncbi:MAG TPA: S53 family peptidase [Candidatus Acidoferrales bacterium]